MNGLDWLIVFGLAWGGWSGWRRGFVREVCQTGFALIALVVAFQYSDVLADAVSLHLSLSPSVLRGISFLMLLVGVAALGYALEPALLRAVHRLQGGLRVQRWGGLLVGTVKALVLALVIVVAVSQLPWRTGQRLIGDSVAAIQLLRMAPGLFGAVREVAPLYPGDRTHSVENMPPI